MLALIALVNSAIYLHARPYGVRQHVIEHALLDRWTATAVATMADNRAYPMFAALFAFGVASMFDRQRAAGLTAPQSRGLLRRRFWWLICFGAVHALLLFPGDVLGLYGLMGFVLLAVLRVRDRTLLVLGATWLLVVAAIQGAALTTPIYSLQRTYLWSFGIEDLGTALLWRPVEWLMTPFGLLGVFSAALAGIWAARHEVLTRPEVHKRQLTVIAATGLTLAFAGGLPAGLAVGGFAVPDSSAGLLAISSLHAVTGVAGGLGYAALIALLASRNPGRLARALAACGERSLSCYLTQSVVFAVLFYPWALGLGAHLGSAATAGIALLTWIGTVLLAELMRRRGRRGPAETLLRRLVYR